MQNLENRDSKSCKYLNLTHIGVRTKLNHSKGHFLSHKYKEKYYFILGQCFDWSDRLKMWLY